MYFCLSRTSTRWMGYTKFRLRELSHKNLLHLSFGSLLHCDDHRHSRLWGYLPLNSWRNCFHNLHHAHRPCNLLAHNGRHHLYWESQYHSLNLRTKSNWNWDLPANYRKSDARWILQSQSKASRESLHNGYQSNSWGKPFVHSFKAKTQAAPFICNPVKLLWKVSTFLLRGGTRLPSKHWVCNLNPVLFGLQSCKRLSIDYSKEKACRSSVLHC